TQGARIWMPPPAVMEVAMEQFNDDRLVSPHNLHVFAIPSLMTHLWRRRLSKAADILFTVPVGGHPGHFWATHQHEPLIVAIVFPLGFVDRYFGPWAVRGHDDIEHLVAELEQGFLYTSGKSRKPGDLPGLEASDDPYPRYINLEGDEDTDLLLTDKDRAKFRCGVDGGHLMGVPFECELCHFRNINRRDPIAGSIKDAQTLVAIRRANLDAMNAREHNTIRANFNQIRRDYDRANEMFTLNDPLPYLPRDDVGDSCGMQQALLVLASSLGKGRYAATKQVETTRKTVTGLTNAYGAAGMHYESDDRDEDEAKWERSPSATRASPLRLPFFKRFMKGLKLRTGVERRQNEALTSDMVNALDEMATRRWHATSDESEKERLEELMCYILIGFACGLRGEEVPLVALNSLLHFWEETRLSVDPHIMIGLFGRFKGEEGHRWHCLPISDETRSGIRVRPWLSLLLHRRVNVQGRRTGYLFCKTGRPSERASLSDYDADFIEFVQELHADRPDLFSRGTVLDYFSLRRSLRRGAILETTGRVSTTTIEAINRWRKKESARGLLPNLCMRQTYTQTRDIVAERLKYSKAL
ncbi:hypothetical protein THAOC_09530, partial [Thalassiosira oceanica]